MKTMIMSVIVMKDKVKTKVMNGTEMKMRTEIGVETMRMRTKMRALITCNQVVDSIPLEQLAAKER